MLVDIANCSVGYGMSVSVCQTRQRGPLTDDLREGIYSFSLNRTRRIDLCAMRRFSSWIKDHAIDVVHVHSRSTLLFLIIAKVLSGFKACILFHDHYGKIDVDQSTPFWFRMMADRVLSAYVGVSSHLEKWALQSGIAANKVITVPNYIDFSRLVTVGRQSIMRQEDRLRGVVVCGLRREKGIDILIRALSMIEHGNFEVVIVGGEAEAGYMAYCLNLAQQLRLEQNITFAGQRDDVPTLLRSFDFAVIPSIAESGPLVLIEFLANGLPVIATRTGEISAIVEMCGVGKFVEPGDVAGLAAGLSDLMSMHPNERKQLGDAGSVLARREFDLRNNISIWLELYQNARQLSSR